MNLKQDIIDAQILRELQNDGRITIKSLSDKLNLSATPIFERIKKLEKADFIKGYTTLLNERKLGLKQIVFISLTLKEHSRSYLEKFEKEIQTFPEVMECYRVTGNFDFLVKVLVTDIEAYENFILTKLSLLKNLGNVQSHIALSEAKNTTKIEYEILKQRF